MDATIQQAFVDLRAEMAQSVATSEATTQQRLENVNTFAKVDGKISGIELIVKHLETMVQASAKDKAAAKSPFNYKDAKDAKPGPWDKTIPFVDLSMELRNWARNLHDDYMQLMDETEKDVGQFLTKDTVDMNKFPDFVELDKYLWTMLVSVVKGDAKGYLKNSAESGFQGWAQLVQHYDPRGSVDKTVAYQRVITPIPYIGQAKDSGQARLLMQTWETEVAQY